MDTKIVWIIERDDDEFYAGRCEWTHDFDQAVQFSTEWAADLFKSTMFVACEPVYISRVVVEAQQ